MSARRSQRIASLIHSELSRILLQDIQDPALARVWIHEVQLTGDLRLAKIFFECSGREVSKRDVEKGLGRAMPYLKRQLSCRLKLRYVPELQFQEDSRTQSIHRVYELLESLNQNSETKVGGN